MGYGEVGILSPGASAFRDPTSQRAEAVGQGLQRASYLSQMDQFYAQLEESTRQFDLSYGLQERAQTLAETSEDWRRDFSYAQLEQQGELGRRELTIRESLGLGQLGIGRGQLDLARDESAREEAIWDKWGDKAMEAKLSDFGGSGGSGMRSPQPRAAEGTVYGSSGTISRTDLATYGQSQDPSTTRYSGSNPSNYGAAGIDWGSDGYGMIADSYSDYGSWDDGTNTQFDLDWSEF